MLGKFTDENQEHVSRSILNFRLANLYPAGNLLAQLKPDVLSGVVDIIENPEKFGRQQESSVLLLRAVLNSATHGIGVPLLKMVERYRDRDKLPFVQNYLLKLRLFDTLVQVIALKLENGSGDGKGLQRSMPYFARKISQHLAGLDHARREVRPGAMAGLRRLFNGDVQTGFQYSMSSDYNIVLIELKKFTDSSAHLSALLDVIAELDVVLAMALK